MIGGLAGFQVDFQPPLACSLDTRGGGTTLLAQVGSVSLDVPCSLSDGSPLPEAPGDADPFLRAWVVDGDGHTVTIIVSAPDRRDQRYLNEPARFVQDIDLGTSP